MEGTRKRGREWKRWTDGAEEDMMIMRIEIEEMEKDFTGSRSPQRTVVHEEEVEEEEEKKKKKERKRISIDHKQIPSSARRIIIL
jgi:hypothetical protein